MKKNILIIALLFITAFSMTFAYIKANEAERGMMMAQEAQVEALRQAKLAEQAASEARMAQADAEEAMAKLMECQN